MVTVFRFRDEIDPNFSPLSTGPFVPQPHVRQEFAILRIVLEEPLADVFPLRAAGVRIRVERVEESGKARVRYDPTSLIGRGGRFNAGVRWWANNPLSSASASVNKAVRHG